MKTLLFVVSSATSYRLHRLLAKHCAAMGYAVHLVYDQPPDALFDELTVDAKSWGGSAVALDELIVGGAQPELRWARMPHPWRARLFSWLTPPDKSVHRRILGERLAAAQNLLRRLAPGAVVVAEDGISGPAALIAAARSLGLPVVDLPYGYGTQADLDNTLDEKAVHEPLMRTSGRLGWLMRLLAPQWIKRGRHAGAIIFPQDYILAREALGMTLRNGWIVHGGYADRLLAESSQMMAMYRSEGVPARKLALTGTPYCDVMANALATDAQAKAAFRQPRPVKPGTIRILVSWPTSYHATRAAHCEFVTYEEMTQSVLGWLNSLPQCELTVSLHPAIPAHARAAIDAMGLRISQEYVVSLIPAHDIYVSYFSSTQRWAIACGKPVVNYDAYGVGLDVYDDAPGFVGTRRFEDFKEQVLRLTEDEEEFLACASAQIAVAQAWGVVDGRCSQRIVEEIQGLERGAEHAF